MTDRTLVSFGALTLLVVTLSPVALAGQTRAESPKAAAQAKPWSPPLAPDGHADLQGFWIVKTATPLERPKELEGKERLTDAEVAELKKRAARIFKAGNSDFGAGDVVFLSALRNVEQYKNPNGTENDVGMIEREFDDRTSLVTDPPDGKIPPVTPQARDRQAAARVAAQRPAAGPEDFSLAYRCITTGVPKLGGLYGSGHFSYYQIVQTRGYVVLATETIHDARIIPLDGRPHPPQGVRFWNGDSVGRWDGNTLVVDTTNFSPKSNFMGSSDHLHLIERFTRVSPDTINYEMTIDDPTTWTKPWTAMVPMRHTADSIQEFACHEGNDVIMRSMLSAARVDEKTEEAKKPR